MLAAEKGIGALSFAFIDPEEARGWVRDYEEALASTCVPVGLEINPSIACVTPMMCHPDEQVALEMGLEGGNFFGYSLGHFYIFGDHVPAETDVWQEFIERRAEVGYSPEAALATEQETLGAKVVAGESSGLRGAVGTPEQIREFLRRYEEAGVDQIIFVMQAGRNRHEDIMSSIELFGAEVLPEFAERDPAQVAAKQQRLAPTIEKAMARRVHSAPPLPEGFSIPAIPKRMIELADNEEGRKFLETVADEQAVGRNDSTRDLLD